MTDKELAAYLGVPTGEAGMAYVRSLTPEKRAVYERMRVLETELALWEAGLGPKPMGVMIDTDRSTRKRKGWR